MTRKKKKVKKKFSTSKRRKGNKRNCIKGHCTYYIVQNSQGYSEDNGNIIIPDNKIFPTIMGNFEIVRCIPPTGILMQNEKLNLNFRKLLNNGLGKKFWQIWNQQFSKNLDYQQKQESNDENIGITQMPLLAKIMQVYGYGDNYYNEMLQHNVDGDFGIWRKCEWSKTWRCVFDNNTINKLFNNNKSIYNLLYNQKGEMKSYSMENLIDVLLYKEKIRSTTNSIRFVFASCSPLKTADRLVSLTTNSEEKQRLTYDRYGKEYWYRKLINLQRRIFIFFKGNDSFIKKVGIHGSINNNLDYKNDLGEVISITDDDERGDIYLQFDAFFFWLTKWKNDGRFLDFQMDLGKERFYAIDSIKYILYYLKKNNYDSNISYDLSVTDNVNSSIYDRLRENHIKIFPEIFQEIENDTMYKTTEISNTLPISNEWSNV